MIKKKSEPCVVCGVGVAHEVRQPVRRVLLGHPANYSRLEFLCDACKERYTDNEQGLANDAAERRAIRSALAHIGTQELRLGRQLADATQAQMEQILGLGKNTLARWETGQRAIPTYIQAIYRLIALNPLAANLLKGSEAGALASKSSTADDPSVENAIVLQMQPAASSYLTNLPPVNTNSDREAMSS